MPCFVKCLHLEQSCCVVCAEGPTFEWCLRALRLEVGPGCLRSQVPTSPRRECFLTLLPPWHLHPWTAAPEPAASAHRTPATQPWVHIGVRIGRVLCMGLLLQERRALVKGLLPATLLPGARSRAELRRVEAEEAQPIRPLHSSAYFSTTFRNGMDPLTAPQDCQGQQALRVSPVLSHPPMQHGNGAKARTHAAAEQLHKYQHDTMRNGAVCPHLANESVSRKKNSSTTTLSAGGRIQCFLNGIASD